jgi:hypothetical protein
LFRFQIKGRTMTETNYQNPPSRSIGKCEVTCHFTNLDKIPEMKSISKPRLPFEIYTFQEIMSTEEFRKKPLLSCKISCESRQTLPKDLQL